MANKMQTHSPKHQPGDKVPLSFSRGTNSICDESESLATISCPYCNESLRGDKGVMIKIPLDGSGGPVFVHATVHPWCV